MKVAKCSGHPHGNFLFISKIQSKLTKIDSSNVKIRERLAGFKEKYKTQIELSDIYPLCRAVSVKSTSKRSQNAQAQQSFCLIMEVNKIQPFPLPNLLILLSFEFNSFNIGPSQAEVRSEV